MSRAWDGEVNWVDPVRELEKTSGLMADGLFPWPIHSFEVGLVPVGSRLVCRGRRGLS